MRGAFWDTEIVGIPEGAQFNNIWDMWPFRMSMAAVAYTDQPTEAWYDWDDNKGMAARAMHKVSVTGLLAHLWETRTKDYNLFGWNSTGFDWPLLDRLTGEHELCVELCKQSYDPCFQMLCARGFPVGLEAATLAIGGRSKEMNGADAAHRWPEDWEAVVNYCKGDVLRLQDVVGSIIKARGLSWITKKGSLSFQTFPGLLTVEECLALPLPDTSWMTKPISREETVAWWTTLG